MKKTPVIFAALIAAGTMLPLVGQAAEDATGAAPVTDTATAPTPSKKAGKHAKKHKTAAHSSKKKTASH